MVSDRRMTTDPNSHLLISGATVVGLSAKRISSFDNHQFFSATIIQEYQSNHYHCTSPVHPRILRLYYRSDQHTERFRSNRRCSTIPKRCKLICVGTRSASRNEAALSRRHCFTVKDCVCKGFTTGAERPNLPSGWTRRPSPPPHLRNV
jgi:hypothetical protein